MTSDVDSLAELVQMGLLMFVSNALLLVVSVRRARARVVEAAAALPDLRAVRRAGQHQVPARLERRLPRRARRHRRARSRSSRRASPACASSRPSAGRTSRPPASRRGNRRLFDAHMRSVQISAWYLPVIEFAGLLTTAIAVGVGGWWVHTGDLTIGTVTFFVLTLSNLFEPIQQLIQLFNIVQSAGAALNKLFGAARHARRRARAPGRRRPPRAGRDQRRGRGVRLRRRAAGAARRRPAHPGGGPHRAGRSHRRRASPRWPSSSRASTTRPRARSRYAGVDLRDATLRSLRERIVVVPQEGFLFNGTILENVRLARAGATDAEVLRRPRGDRRARALRAASRGARHRGAASAARGCRRARSSSCRWPGPRWPTPRVLVLDEATSSLDPGTEVVVEEAMARLMEGRTVIVIAHRLSTAERADSIGVVTDGPPGRAGHPRRAGGQGRPLRPALRHLVRGLATTI